MQHAGSRIAIIGAGPIGLEAALFAKQRGFDVTVLERTRVANNLWSWGHVRLFSPFAMNVSRWGRAALTDAGSTPASSDCTALPGDEDLLTGAEFAERYLLPLSRHPLLAGVIRENVEVLAVGRSGCWKGDLTGSARRDSPFRLLIRTEKGEETLECDFVLDCSGTYPNHNWLGSGGVPCPGETRNEERIVWTLPDVLGRDRNTFAGKRTLVVGSGFSAATTVVGLARLALDDPATSVVWVTRTDRERPLATISNDVLTERAGLTRRANELATEQGGGVDWKPSTLIRSLNDGPDGGFLVSIESRGSELGSITADHIVAQVGYRPDRAIYEELQVHECYATQGPMRLAAALLGETSGDCLNQSCPGPETLTNPEPGFFILGAKSYGRNSQFLLRIGIEQIEAVFSLIPDP